MFARKLVEGDQPLPIISQPFYGFRRQLPIVSGELCSECLARGLRLRIGHGTQEGTRLGLLFPGQRVKDVDNPMIPTPLLRQRRIWLA